MAAATWVCPNCGRRQRARFCPLCGEEPLRERDLTLRDLVAQFARTFSSVDGRLLRSFRLLLTAPGAISVAHVRGQRRSFLGPLPLFLIANALFFAVQSLTQTNIFSSPLASHLHGQDWSALARQLVAPRLEDQHRTLAAYAPIFDNAVLLNAKALIVLMALVFAPFLPLVFYGQHRPFGAHVIFSLHLYSFLLLVFCVSVLLAEADLLLGGGGLKSPRVDFVLSLFNLIVCLGYVYSAIGRFYGSKGLTRAIKALGLAAVLATIFVGYRFVVFLITLYSS